MAWVLCVSKAQAVTYIFGIDNLGGTTSQGPHLGSTLEGMEVRIGVFASGFDPTIANYDDWLANFSVLYGTSGGSPTTGVETLVLTPPGVSFSEPEDGEFGIFEMTNPTITVTSDIAGFTHGQHMYVWITNNTTAGASTQAALLLTDWAYVSVASGAPSPPAYGFHPTTQLIVGTVFDDYDSFIGSNGEYANHLITAQIPANIPEPKISLLAMLGFFGVLMRRRRGVC